MELLIGRKIKAIRMIVSGSQTEFAETIGISRATLAQIEIDKQKPTFEHLISIVNIYNIPFDFFLRNDKNLEHFVKKQLLDYGKVTESFNDTVNTSIVEENNNEYITTCDFCKMKDEIIESQKDLIQQLKENNALLKEKLKDCLETSPKKKAS